MHREDEPEKGPKDHVSEGLKTACNVSPEKTAKLLEDLRLHQVELEMQNEELKKAQQVIEEGRQRLADLYDFAPVGYLTLNAQNVVEEANLTAATLLGTVRQVLVGASFLQYVDSHYAAEYRRHHERVVKSRAKAVCELRLQKRDGNVFWARMESVPVTPGFDDGDPVLLRTVFTDITERKEAEEALLEGEEKYRVLVESVNSIIARLDGEGRVIFLNDYGRDFFGYSEEELWGTGLVGTILPPGQYGLDAKEFLIYMADHPEDYREREIEMVRRNGEKVWVSWMVRTLYDEKGVFTGMLAVGNDVTERRRLEGEIRQAQKMEAIGTLAGGIAHDFNNILAGIIGFAEMIEEDSLPGSKDARRAQRIITAASRGADLVRQILAFSRKAEIAREPLSLSPLIGETVRFLRSSLPATIEIQLAVKASDDTVLASPSEIQQILMNLVTNASFAMMDTGGIIRAVITNVVFEPESPILDPDIEPGEYVQISVQDSGSGMSPDIMQRIFEPFFTTKGVGQGTGMGLAVVFGIVKSLHGAISVESERGIGSTFRVLLPMARAAKKDEDPEAVLPPGGTERILFVDDEELIAEWGQTALEGLGYAVTVITDSEKALVVFTLDPSNFDLVIVDQTMPKMTGFHLARRLLATRADIPIILCTGHSETVSPEYAKEAGIKEFLMKPLRKRQLAEAVRKVLDTRE